MAEHPPPSPDESPHGESPLDDVAIAPERPSAWRRALRPLGAHPILSTVLGLVLIVAGVVAYQLRDAVDPAYRNVTFAVPDAPTLTANGDETLYRIDPTRSEARYEIGETIFGAEASTAIGRTNGIAGDIVVNRTDPPASRVGEVVVNVEQLTSDSSLRDARIRSDFLQSHQYSFPAQWDPKLGIHVT